MTTVRATMQKRERELASFIDRLVGEMEPLHKAMNEASWNANVTGEARHEADAARCETQMRQLFSNEESMGFLRRLESAGGVNDAQLARQLQLLLNAHQAQQMAPERIADIVAREKKLETRFNTFRAQIDGEAVTDNAIRMILQESDDAAVRHRAWEASKQIGAAVVDELLELVRRRNDGARSMGYDNFYSMSLKLDEIDEDELFRVLDVLDRETQPLFESYRTRLDTSLSERFGIEPADVRPWHLADPFFQSAPATGYDLDAVFAGKDIVAISERFFTAVGLETRSVLDRSDLYEKPGKCQHAFCMPVDRGDDVRVLCNIRPDEKWMATMLHELGHAVYEVCLDRSLPFLLRESAHLISTEASAMLFGRLSKNAAWLVRYAGMDPEEARRAEAAIAPIVRTQLLVQTRWCLVMCHMERALYANPDQDLNTLWWDLVARFQRVTRPEGRNAPDWASKVHFSSAPVYYQNYMLGEMMASQLQQHIQNDVLGDGSGVWERYVTSPAVGAFLREKYYAPGATRDWRDTLIHATGQPLEPSAFVAELAGRA